MKSIIPVPVSVTAEEGHFVLAAHTPLVGPPDAHDVMAVLCRELSPAPDSALPICTSSPSTDPPSVQCVLVPSLDAALGTEGYRLTVTPTAVTIEAAAKNGLFYGGQTLRQLLPEAIYDPRRGGGQPWRIPCVRIEDKPRFAWRGMHLDVSRHFMPVAFIKKYIDLLAMHKFNVFHWHLTDDQGWRLEIQHYPKLTDVGAWRKETLIGHKKRPRQTWQFDGVRHGGFYTQDDVREIVAYAAARCITVVPEIDMPGHTQAVVAAYPELGLSDNPVEVMTYWGISEQILNVEPETVRFMQDVLAEVLDLFPSPYIHIGGDEVLTQPWKDDRRTQRRIAALGLADENELQSWFTRQMQIFLSAHGRRLIGWDEILEGRLEPGAVVMSWRGETGGIAAANAGFEVVMAPNHYTYFDFYQTDPASEPLAIEGLTPLEKVYAYDPVHSDVAPAQARFILGAQGQVWTEYMSTAAHVEYMAFPRTCALAEVVWSSVDRREFSAFRTRLATHLRRLSALDVNYCRSGLD